MIVNKVGYLANLKTSTYTDQNGNEIAAVILYFIKEDSSWFKAIKIFEPYFLVQCEEEHIK